MCQSGNNPTIEQTTAEGQQWAFNVARNSRTRKRLSAGPLKNMYTSTSTVIMDVILNPELYTISLPSVVIRASLFNPI